VTAIKRLKKHLSINRNGSVIVDAAISIPLFIYSMFLLILLISQCGHEAETFSEMVSFADNTVKAIAAAGSDSSGISMNNDSGCIADNVLVICRTAKPEINCPDIFDKKISSDLLLAFRPFMGESEYHSSLDNSMVYIFPKRGECYHVADCVDMRDGCIQYVLNDRIRRKYKACGNCKPEIMSDGSIVYLSSSQGRVYHRKKCSSITKMYAAVQKSEAVTKGYRPCKHCGGGEWKTENTE